MRYVLAAMTMRDISRQVRGWMKKLVGVTDSNEALARGAAVGFFFGVSFFWGLQILLAIIGAQLLRGNKVVAASMTAISNPATSLPLYTASLRRRALAGQKWQLARP
jgi:uncharacterized protein